MQVDFLFLVPLTPPAYLDDVRSQLKKMCFNQLAKLNASKRVWALGEGAAEDADVEFISTTSVTKEDKLLEVGKMLANHDTPIARYIIRLDDDDLINPVVFDTLANQEFDVAYDAGHCFYDLSSGLTSQQIRPWIANTAIHKYECALEMVAAVGGSPLAGNKNFLFACDHSQAWHTFYRNKKKYETRSEEPLYLRVLSPGSITAKGSNSNEADSYYTYLSSFGLWERNFPLTADVRDELLILWEQTNGPLMNRSFSKQGIVQRILKKVKP